MAKAKKTAAKPAKSSTGPNKPGVIATIVEMISRTEGASKDEILKILIKKFPDRDPDGASAQKLVDLLVDGLAARFEALARPPEPTPSDVTQPVADESVS